MSVAPDAPRGLLEIEARQLAATHVLSENTPRPLPILTHRRRYADWLARTRAAMEDADPALAKAAEWLLDNEYIVARAIRQIKDDLPPKFYARLPALGGRHQGLPRVRSVAETLLATSRLQLSLERVTQFVHAYQERTPLTIGELWALPTFLRVGCLEVLADAFARLEPTLHPSFTVDRLPDVGLEPAECVGRAITTLRTVASIPWKDFFCRTSRVEAILAEDPAGVYSRMDFETRDAYRKTVEELARTSAHSEVEVADRAVSHARDALRASARRAHVGYWLVGDGLEDFERSIRRRLTHRVRSARWMRKHAAFLYLSALAVATSATMAFPVWYLVSMGAAPSATLLTIVLTLLPASQLAITFVQWVVTMAVPPTTLPKLDFDARIPDEYATAVVMPTLVRDADDARRQLERLEMHHLANSDPAAQYVLLSDFVDATAETLPSDEATVTALKTEVRRLNEKYRSRPFHVLHRPRRFNPREGVWMGWERKRGKLEQFNRLLGGAPDAAFMMHEGNRTALEHIRYVVTLDADTVLPRGTLSRLIGSLAHPLNRPEFDEANGRVRTGYTIVQPRVEIAPESGNRSILARWFTGDTAIDIYSRAVSDVYQDLFGCGIYVGKGAYDVDAFRRSLDDRAPEDALLSHDLFEGLHGRVALATDILLYEGFPRHYVEFARRAHRWIRGDWQLLPWLWRRVPAPGGRRIPNRFSWVDRWKIIDNLRRSLLSPSLLVMLTAGWLILPGHPGIWTLLGLCAPAGHLFTDLVTGLARGRRRTALTGCLQRVSDQVGRWVLLLLFLPYDAAVAFDAIARTVVRVYWTHRHLLEWTPAAHAEAAFARDDRRFVWREMRMAPVVAVVVFVALAWSRPDTLPIALPLLLAWSVAPEVAYRLGCARPVSRMELAAAHQALLRAIARRTWRFFEVFAAPDDQWLPPDNFQEAPRGDVAHRTSPTNIGMMFLSSISACDLGYLGLIEWTSRLKNTLDTLDRMVRHRGHFFNWYHTRTLHPLEPRYVSTVDSGNLAMSLLALKEACHEYAAGPVVPPQRWEGFLDSVGLLTQAIASLPVSSASASRLRRCLDAVAAKARSHAAAAHPSWTMLRDLRERDLVDLDHALHDVLETECGSADLRLLREVRIWLERVHHEVRSATREDATLCPWRSLLDQVPAMCTAVAARVAAEVFPTMPLPEADDRCRRALTTVQAASEELRGSETWATALVRALEEGERAAIALRADLASVAARAEAIALAMDFRLLYDRETRLLHLGYNLSADRLDDHHYDLLASEARLASLFAIAKGDVPVEHWFHLGRPITRIGRRRCLLSWGGSMFEYLMPSLFVRSERGTLLAESEQAAVEAHQHHGSTRGIPWGMSESAFAAMDADHVYQYRSFGVPQLGFRRGISEDAVVAPYASVLALPVAPDEAIENCRRLQALALIGEYGFYEAADFTPGRTASNGIPNLVRCYMAHHQGMILAAISNALAGDALVRRVGADPRVRAVSLLLHERVPLESPAETVGSQPPIPHLKAGPVRALEPWVPTRAGAFPEMHMLGNGRLASWITDSGSGALHWREWNLTRWIADAIRDDSGLWVYIRDNETGQLWSATRQPLGPAREAVDVIYHPHLVEFHRRDGTLGIRLEVVVGAADDIEIRRLTLINDGDEARRLTITTYGEVVLAKGADHERHPAFSKLLVRSEHIPHLNGVAFMRRSRTPDEHPPALLHWMISDEAAVRFAGVETDRAAFLGRGRTPHDPAALVQSDRKSVGYTLDPILALRVDVVVEPRTTTRLAFATAAASSRESVVELAERYQTMSAVEWAMADAQAEAARELQRLTLPSGAMAAIQTLGSLVAFRHHAVRASADVIAGNHLGQSALWGLGLSGDLPVILVKVPSADALQLLDDLVGALAFWRRRQLLCDLVVLYQGASGYHEPIGEALRARLHAVGWRAQLGQHASVHLLIADHVQPEIARLVEAVAQVVLDTRSGSLAAQLKSVHVEPLPLPRFVAAMPIGHQHDDCPPLERPADLLFDNGFGGFTTDGREYVVHLARGDTTPAPWCNVLANADFGTLVTESGTAFTWSLNSAEHRLTPWSNDPVSDPPGEVLYIRDEETAAVWTPTPQPAPAPCSHQIRHGAGYTSWHSRSHGLSQDLVVFVAPDDPVKIVRLRLHNHTARPRRLTVTYYAEWVLGPSRQRIGGLIMPEYDDSIRALLVRNPWASEFATRTAFLTSNREPHGITADRAEFLGREGTLRLPAALERWGLSGRVSPGPDPCAALQIHVDLAPGAADEVVFLLGDGSDRPHAVALASKYREPGTVATAWQQLGQFWDARLGVVQVKTPDKATNIMLNRWLLYQTLSSRLLGRTGFYQSSGAIGFRDQLQDVLALVMVEPSRCRAHLLECAARQFEEGDVLHWWHPPTSRGVRTRCSDDLLWLPFAVAHYVEATGDSAVLDEQIPFLQGRMLGEHEDDLYATFGAGERTASLLEHCERALERGVTRGPHGLPLIGAGDWNDGMNRVGRRGRGESVWLAWFAITTMNRFAEMCRRRNRGELADRWSRRARELLHALEESAWDGDWYCRAFDDDGKPWGSRTAEECQIDSTAQTWAVMSGLGSDARIERAMHAVETRLIDTDARLVRLLTPPFANTPRDPGYIKAYPPGVRENGGQYTHAAVWVGWAFADLRDGDRVADVMDLLNPIHRSLDRASAQRFRVEPYVLAADIYGAAPHTGRGGWTWYSGSAAWMWRLGIERLIGLRLDHGALRIEPRLPASWHRVEATIRSKEGTLVITIENPEGSADVREVCVDGNAIPTVLIPFPRDGREHRVVIHLGKAGATASAQSSEQVTSA